MESVRFITEDETTSKDMSADFGCIFTGREIGAPGVKTKFVDIPFRSGSIDEYGLISSVPIYENRTITMNFLCANRQNQNLLISNISEFIHGKKLWIQFSDDIGYLYKAQVASIKNIKQSNYSLTFTIVCICDPYKYSVNGTLVDWEWDTLDLVNGVINDVGELTIAGGGTATFTLICSDDRAFPVVTTSARITVKAQKPSEEIYTSQIVKAGTQKLYDLTFYKGENLITISNSASSTTTVKIEYRGKCL